MASIAQQLKQIQSGLDRVMQTDRMAARREIRRIRGLARNPKAAAGAAARCAALADKMTAATRRKAKRWQQRPAVNFDPALPITAHKDEIIDLIKSHQTIIVAGQTGSGKTTQLPKMCLAAGRGKDGLIGCTQPRRIAAVTVAKRIAEELGQPVGKAVGHKIRFQDSGGADSLIKIMTDGILLAETQADRFLNAYDTLIIDEAHERSLNVDFILGILKTLLPKRPDLKLIITSATIDTEKFAKAFDNAPVVEVSGRMYPVDTRYVAPEDNGDEAATHIEMAVAEADRLCRKGGRGDVLIFMPTEQDIRDTCVMLDGRRLRHTFPIPLFARLAAGDQQKVFAPCPGRKIIVATNVAETSITIPGIRYVIDTGLARISKYAPRTRTTTLPVLPISRSSADQRQGRCGRVSNGVCIRLYSEADYQSRPRFTEPEILRANLAEVILRMTALKLPAVDHFPFIDPPAENSVKDGVRLLEELGAIRPAKARSRTAPAWRLTARGQLMARLPLDPRLARMLIEARQRSCLAQVSVLAAALSIQDPRERPAEKRAAADQAHARFADPWSDFMTWLNIWRQWRQTVDRRSTWREVKTFCTKNFLSFKRMREWQDVHRQICAVLAEHDMAVPRLSKSDAAAGERSDFDPQYTAIHKAVLSGFLSNIAQQKEKQIFTATRHREAMIFPGSALFKQPGKWIVAAEMVVTSRLFARQAARIDQAWLEEIGKPLCKYTYMDPHWERKRGQVVATEQVSLFGLVIDQRKKAYGAIDPDASAEIFIQRALIDGDVARPLAFMDHNRRLIEEIEQIEDRIRRRDLLVDDQDQMEFYAGRLPGITDMRSLEHLIRRKGEDTFLRMKKSDLALYDPAAEELARYPEKITVDGNALKCEYRFAPGKEEDGVTVKVPARKAAALRTEPFDWLVPGLQKEKITALIKGLEKRYRRQLVPIGPTVDIIMDQMPDSGQRLINALSDFIHRRFGVDIPASAWPENALPDHLRMRLAVMGPDGKVLRTGRNPEMLKQVGKTASAPKAFETARRRWAQTGITGWDFGDLADTVTIKDDAGHQYKAYPALTETDKGLCLEVFADAATARKAHARGVRALLEHELAADLKHLKKNLRLPAAVDAVARRFNGRARLEALLYDTVADRLLAGDIRRQADYHSLVDRLRGHGIAGTGGEMRDRAEDVLQWYGQARRKLEQLASSSRSNPPVLAFLTQRLADLDQLVPERFVALYDTGRMAHLERYIRALTIRCERAVVDLEKDRRKAEAVAVFSDRLHEVVVQLDARASDAKRAAVEAFFWMVEEFKISVFAQEVKTDGPISAKRLKTALAQIERMV